LRKLIRHIVGIGQMSKTIYVQCTISKGLFETEFYIKLKDSSAYVDRSNVIVDYLPHRGSEVSGKVRAYLVTEEADRALIELPGEPVVGGLRTWVPKGELAYA